MTSERFPGARNVSVLNENMAQNAIRTTSEPTVGVAKARPSRPVPRFDGAIVLVD
jgi:hypothetical protein